MIGAIGEIAGCLLAAAAIGGVTGWLLRHISVAELKKHIYDLTTALQIKDQTLHSTQLELKAKASTILIYDGKLATAEALAQSRQQELAVQTQRHLTLQAELAAATQRIAALESDHQATLQRHQESDATIAAFEQEARQANAARTAAQQALVEKEEELQDLRTRLVEVEANLAKLERLRVQISDLEPAQGRVHWLEVQLSEKDVQHRAALHEVEEQKAELARRLAELEPLARKAEDQEVLLRDLDAKYHKALKHHATDASLVDTQRGAIQDLQAALTERDRALEKQEGQLAALQRQLKELQALHTDMDTQQNELRAGLRIRSDKDTVVVASAGQLTDQLDLHIGQTASIAIAEKDDLTKIRGIGPAQEQALNKMGTFTYVQIARWTPDDIARAARQLSTPLDRIKKHNWIASAKKQHLAKYGERL